MIDLLSAVNRPLPPRASMSVGDDPAVKDSTKMPPAAPPSPLAAVSEYVIIVPALLPAKTAAVAVFVNVLTDFQPAPPSPPAENAQASMGPEVAFADGQVPTTAKLPTNATFGKHVCEIEE